MIRTLVLAWCLAFPLACYAGGVSPGEPAPGFELPTLPGGEPTALHSYRGKVVYLDFWASWCGPCRVSFPLLDALRQELGEAGFEVLAVSVDEDRADALEFLHEVPVSYPVVHDAAAVTPQMYGIMGMPTGYLIDRDGVVHHIHRGFKRSDGAKLRAAVIDLLGE